MADIWQGVMNARQQNQATGQSAKIYSPEDVANDIFIPRFSYTKDGLAFMSNNADSSLNALNQQALWNREDLLRGLAEKREDYSMDRIVEAAKRNGINPIFLVDALSGNTVGNAASYSTSAAKTSNFDTNARTDQANNAKLFGALIAALGIVFAHVI